jgi:hypothetical protein
MDNMSNATITLVSLAVLVAGAYLLYKLARKYLLPQRDEVVPA